MAQQNFAEMVKKRREEIKSLEGIKKRYETSQKDHDRNVEAIKKELKKVDEDIEKLHVDFRLDSFEERCKCH